MAIKIALGGNPNSGKTTLYNELTGSTQYVGNWAGVTVEKKEGTLKGHKEITIVDLPGVYSLSPYTLEEVVTRDFLLDESPQLIINIIDASNIERNLYLTTQLIELGIPVIVALNMYDVVTKNKDKIDCDALSKQLGCPVLPISALKQTGIQALIEMVVTCVKNPPKLSHAKFIHSPEIEQVITSISKYIQVNSNTAVYENKLRFIAVKLFERDEKIKKKLDLSREILEKLKLDIATCESELDDDSESIITNERYTCIETIVKQCVHKNKMNQLTTSDKIDQIVTNRWLALPIFIFIMWFVYYISISSLGTIVTDWTNDVLFGGYVTDFVTNLFTSMGVADLILSLVVNGIIGGVGAVLGFVPQILILFFFLSILEDCGYMARVAFIMDRIFRKFGLSGKSFIPMLISSGCGVPGIMATRTIEQERDRKMTIMVTTFIPCSAKLPIIALIGGSFFPGNSLIAPSMYFLGILMVILSGVILKKTALFAGEVAPFVMELPQYHFPAPKGIFTHMWDRTQSFIVKAGTVIFIASGVIWFLSNFNFQLQMVDTPESILVAIGTLFSPIFAPLGFDTWQATVATITGLVAKENVVGTFGVLYGLGQVSEDNTALLGEFALMLTSVGAYSFMIFNMLCAPCFAAIGAIKREMGNWKWTLIAVGYQTILAYVISLIVYQLGRVLVLGESVTIGTLFAGILILIIIGLIIRPNDAQKKIKSPSPKKITV
ncbi:MAG: ferrous iron transport protein B [Oscillospiraceae bacterium]